MNTGWDTESVRYLVYRTIDLMRQLALDAGWSDEQFTVRSEAENVNLFIEAHK